MVARASQQATNSQPEETGATATTATSATSATNTNHHAGKTPIPGLPTWASNEGKVVWRRWPNALKSLRPGAPVQCILHRLVAGSDAQYASNARSNLCPTRPEVVGRG